MSRKCLDLGLLGSAEATSAKEGHVSLVQRLSIKGEETVPFCQQRRELPDYELASLPHLQLQGLDRQQMRSEHADGKWQKKGACFSRPEIR